MVYKHALLQAFTKVPNGPLWFGLPIINIQNSVVTLNVKADNLTFTVNSSPGRIMFAQVSRAIELTAVDHARNPVAALAGTHSSMFNLSTTCIGVVLHVLSPYKEWTY